MFLYKINDKLFLHKKEFIGQELQDIVSGMMMEYRQKVVPLHLELAPLRREPKEKAKLHELEAKIPSPYDFFEEWGFTQIEISAQANTAYEILESREEK